MENLLGAQRIAELIHAGVTVDDEVFDSFISRPSPTCPFIVRWTPVRVALQVVSWIEQYSIETVVDIGSGTGKFCVVAALASTASFLGIESSPGRVRDARQLASTFRVHSRVHFVEGAAREAGIPAAQAYYLFNPFEEHLLDPAPNKRAAMQNIEQFMQDVTYVERFLEQAPLNTYVIKYNGFGGKMPQTYTNISTNHSMPCSLRLWRKDRV